MIWILSVQAFQYSPGLELPSIRFIGRVGGGGEGQCVEDGSFGVLRISSTDRSHCTFVCQDAGTLIGIDRIGEEMRYSLHIGTLARSLRSEEHTSELQSRQYLVCRLL